MAEQKDQKRHKTTESEMQVTLNTGATMPLVGFGTWKLTEKEAGPAVTAALETGYKMVDCAAVYANEGAIGKDAFAPVFAKGTVKREDVFVTSKIWNNKHKAADVPKACEATLKDLNLEYLDLYLIHWPVATKEPATWPQKLEDIDDVSIKETWQAMEKLVEAGKCKAIGVSNFTIKKLEDLLSYAKIVPAVNQVELHPYLSQPELRKYCAGKKIQVTAYSSLGSADSPFRGKDDPVLLEEKCIVDIAKKHGRSTAQIALRWGVDLGCNVLPKSRSAARVKENREIAEFKLDEEDKRAIDALNKNFRLCTGSNIFGENLKDFKTFWDGEWHQ